MVRQVKKKCKRHSLILSTRRMGIRTLLCETPNFMKHWVVWLETTINKIRLQGWNTKECRINFLYFENRPICHPLSQQRNMQEKVTKVTQVTHKLHLRMQTSNRIKLEVNTNKYGTGAV